MPGHSAGPGGNSFVSVRAISTDRPQGEPTDSVRVLVVDDDSVLARAIQRVLSHDGFYVDSLAWVFYQRGEFQTAAETLERAIELAGDDPTVAEHLGDAYRKLGRRTDALRVYREALAKTKEDDQQARLRRKIGALEYEAVGSALDKP